MKATREIPLTRGMVALVDAEDYDQVVEAGLWHPKPGRSGDVYVQRNIKRGDVWTTQTMHQFLTDWPLVDHVNGDGLDNRRSNLRSATRSQNMQNMQRPIGASGYKGVSWHRKARKWAARITIAGKTRSLGYFAEREDAADAYDAAALELFGAFAHLNNARHPKE